MQNCKRNNRHCQLKDDGPYEKGGGVGCDDGLVFVAEFAIVGGAEPGGVADAVGEGYVDDVGEEV